MNVIYLDFDLYYFIRCAFFLCNLNSSSDILDRRYVRFLSNDLCLNVHAHIYHIGLFYYISKSNIQFIHIYFNERKNVYYRSSSLKFSPITSSH